MSSEVWVLTLAVALMELTTRGAIARFLWHRLLLGFIVLETLGVRLVRIVVPPRFVILGSCQKRGVCCRQIVGDPPAFVKRTFLLQLFAAYHRVFHNFRAVARGPRGEVIFSCGYLKTDGRCGIYGRRPMLCRNYPVLPWFDAPRLLPGCGFRFAPRVVAAMKPRESLPIINPRTAVHHPSPTVTPKWVLDALAEAQVPPEEAWMTRALPDEELPEHFEHFDDS